MGYKILVFGKDGCNKCKQLLKRVDKVLKKYKTFIYEYVNISTVDGLFLFAKAETINGQRIPALQILKYNKEEDRFLKIRDTREEKFIDDSLFVPVYLQIQTDYSNPKKSVITNKNIEELIDLALGGN